MKRLFTIIVVIQLATTLQAQSPQKMSYQAVIRNSSNALVTSTAVGMRVSILQGSATGTEVYKETYNPNPQTNANGLVSIEIGNGVPITGTFASINWANGTYFIKTETDPTGGTNYTITGTSQLLSVPYALYAKTAGSGSGFSGSYNDLTNKPVVPLTITPRIATSGQLLSVSFSGGDNVTFSQASPTCPNTYADVILTFNQVSGTTIIPIKIEPICTYFIDSKRFDAVFDINSGWYATGLYDIVLAPSSACPITISRSFKIDHPYYKK